MGIDTTDLGGVSFRCIDGCALCCLCQPELNGSEVEEYKKDPVLSRGTSTRHFDGKVTEEPTAILLQNGSGACHFLRSRRCTAYEKRPRFCRQFPVHFHVLGRVQTYANRSCRGIEFPAGKTGNAETENELASLANELFAKMPEGYAQAHLDSTRARLAEFSAACKNAGIYQSQERLLQAGEVFATECSRKGGIGRLMAFAGGEEPIGQMPIARIAGMLQSQEEPEGLASLAEESNFGQFELEDPAWLPVYCDEKFQWNTLQTVDGRLTWMTLSENGNRSVVRRLAKGEVGLLTPDSAALAAFGEYAGAIVRRDQFFAYAALVCAQEELESDMMAVFAGVLGTTMLDLWWRASLVARMGNAATINGRIAREGIRAFDMDCLDLPGIGGFI